MRLANWRATVTATLDGQPGVVKSFGNSGATVSQLVGGAVFLFQDDRFAYLSTRYAASTGQRYIRALLRDVTRSGYCR